MNNYTQVRQACQLKDRKVAAGVLCGNDKTGVTLLQDYLIRKLKRTKERERWAVFGHPKGKDIQKRF